MTDMTNVPPAPTASVKYAGFWVRFVAYVVDSVILFIPYLIVIVIINLAFNINAQTLGGKIVDDVCEFIIFWIYFVSMTYFVGATLGKMLVGIKVESENFKKLSFGKVLLRETIGKIVSALIILIGYIIAGFTQKKQALHDKFAGSVVVYKNPSKPFGPGLVVGIIIATILPIIAFIGILSSIVLVSLSDARQNTQQAQIQYQQAQAQEQAYEAQISSSSNQ